MSKRELIPLEELALMSDAEFCCAMAGTTLEELKEVTESLGLWEDSSEAALAEAGALARRSGVRPERPTKAGLSK